MCGRWNKKNALKGIYVYVLCKLELNTTKSNKKQQQKKKTAGKTPSWRCFSSSQIIEVSLFFFQKNVKHVQFYNYLVYFFFYSLHNIVLFVLKPSLTLIAGVKKNKSRIKIVLKQNLQSSFWFQSVKHYT